MILLHIEIWSNLTKTETNLLIGLIVSTRMQREIIELFSGQTLNPALIF